MSMKSGSDRRGRLAAWLSEFQLSKYEKEVLLAFYAGKPVATEKDTDEVANTLKMSTALVKHYRAEGLKFLWQCVSRSDFAVRFGSGEIVTAVPVVSAGAAVGDKSAAVAEAKKGIAKNLRKNPSKTQCNKLPKITAFQYLVLLLAYADAGKLRSDKEIALILNTQKSVTEDAETSSNEEIARWIAAYTSEMRGLITPRVVADHRRWACQKLGDGGISVWHYIAERFSELDAEYDDKQAAVQECDLSPQQQKLQENIDLMLSVLNEAERQCLRKRCEMNNGKRKGNAAALASLAEDGYPMKLRTFEKHFERITYVLKTHRIHIWAVLMAHTNGQPEVLIGNARITQ